MLFSARTNDVIELNVINGTLNLNLGGNVDSFEAVIGEPPATSSELTLIQALGKINQVLQKILPIKLELVSKELNHLAAILQHYAGSLIFMK